MTTQTTIYAYTDQPYAIPKCPADDPAKFWAGSHGASHTPISRAPFCTGDDRFFDGTKPMFFGSREWLYYPEEFSRALLEAGIHNEVYCHSGRTVRDGVYVD